MGIAEQRRMIRGLTSQNVTFALLSFEGPDPYARAGGLGVRVAELSGALAEAGFPVHLLFVGDPFLPGLEARVDGRLTLHRWCQWISAYHLGGVYDGEEDKLRDFSRSAPPFVVEQLARPAIEAGRLVVVMAEEWQTAEAMCRVGGLLASAGLRERAVLLWNANNTMGFHRVDWPRLARSATLTTVSRFMKHLMWRHGVNPLVIPNGIPRRLLEAVDRAAAERVRQSLATDTLLLKVARWDPDKRWRSAVETVARLKSGDRRARLVARGGVEAHGAEVLAHARGLGLRVRDVRVGEQRPEAYAAAFARADDADVVNVTTPIPQELLRMLYHGADAVLANSGREPFGLVGLETMAAGGTAFTGSTGEEYVHHLQNGIVLDTDDPDEATWYVAYLAEHPEARRRIQSGAQETAHCFTWERVVENLLGKIEFLAARQGALLNPPEPILPSAVQAVSGPGVAQSRPARGRVPETVGGTPTTAAAMPTDWLAQRTP